MLVASVNSRMPYCSMISANAWSFNDFTYAMAAIFDFVAAVESLSVKLRENVFQLGRALFLKIGNIKVFLSLFEMANGLTKSSDKTIACNVNMRISS